jgi:DNA-binding transcriptional LysR family regulator
MFASLRHLLLIVEHGTFTEAARRAHLSQPALTASIRKLEEDIGAPLLLRGRTGAELTAAGQALLPHARAALVAVEDARRAARQVELVEAGEVRIGGGATACTYLLPPILAAYRKRYPRVALRLRETNPEQAALDALEAGALDMAVVMSDKGDLFRKDELLLVAAKGVDPSTAAFLTFPRGATTRALLDRHFPGADIAMELSSISALKGNVRAGIGIALISRAAVATDLAIGRLLEVRHKKTPIPRDMRLVHRGVDRLSPATKELRRLLLEDAPKRRR